MNCGVAQALEQVADWWTLLIVRNAFFDKTRFSEFQESL
ncbi:MAG: helix-turn-helix transcriptional regulator, partial [bacterium]|nr:helix-turn-helix transcriptional regulator [bacterium]